jgi:hypothetical protein
VSPCRTVCSFFSHHVRSYLTDSLPIYQSGNWRNITCENTGSPSLVASRKRSATAGYLYWGVSYKVCGWGAGYNLPNIPLGMFSVISWRNDAFPLCHVGNRTRIWRCSADKQIVVLGASPKFLKESIHLTSHPEQCAVLQVLSLCVHHFCITLA